MKLDASERKKLKASDFALPGERKYPIQDENHARLAIAMVSKYGSNAEQEEVKAAVHKRYPGIK